jgi:hypothetical protein
MRNGRLIAPFGKNGQVFNIIQQFLKFFNGQNNCYFLASFIGDILCLKFFYGYHHNLSGNYTSWKNWLLFAQHRHGVAYIHIP